MLFGARRNWRAGKICKHAKRHALRKRRTFGRIWAMEPLESRALLSAVSGDVNVGILLLDRSAPRALMNTGSGGVYISNGALVINSNHARAGVDRGSGNVTAAESQRHVHFRGHGIEVAARGENNSVATHDEPTVQLRQLLDGSAQIEIGDMPRSLRVSQ
jgi:hypothetical protein